MINLGTVRPVNIPLTASEQALWRTKPHKFLRESAKVSAASCSMRSYVALQVKERCWRCGVVEVKQG